MKQTLLPARSVSGRRDGGGGECMCTRTEHNGHVYTSVVITTITHEKSQCHKSMYACRSAVRTLPLISLLSFSLSHPLVGALQGKRNSPRDQEINAVLFPFVDLYQKVQCENNF
jgi:hypothetical protein